jgi:hypothetical protein
MRRGIRLRLILYLSGCAGPLDLSTVKCNAGDDQTCPTGYWCASENASVHECRSEATSPPPRISLIGLSVNGSALSKEVLVSAKVLSSVAIRISNQSPYEVTPQIELTAPPCLGISGPGKSGILQAQSDWNTSILMNPEVGCPSPSSVLVKMSAKGKTATDSFTVIIQK